MSGFSSLNCFHMSASVSFWRQRESYKFREGHVTHSKFVIEVLLY